MRTYRTAIVILATGALSAAGWFFYPHTVALEPLASSTSAASNAPPASAAIPVEAAQPAPPPHRQERPALHPDNLPRQHFTMDARRDTVLHTQGGCAVHVPALAFVDADGRPVKGLVAVDITEVLCPSDYVLGNMLTLYNGRPLESAGSFCVTARAGGAHLELAAGKALDMAVPTANKRPRMQLFPGAETVDGVEWCDPQPMQAPEAEHTAPQVELERGHATNASAPMVDAAEMDLGWQSEIHADSTAAGITGQARGRVGVAVPITGNAPVVAGWNTFRVDSDMNYFFRLKKLGWANIDRLANDSRTRKVQLVTTVKGAPVQEDVCIALIVPGHRIYIPGYRKADGSFGFAHSDAEPMHLPVGAAATIVATAHTDGRFWYALQPITIAERADVVMTLKPTTAAGLREQLLAEL